MGQKTFLALSVFVILIAITAFFAVPYNSFQSSRIAVDTAWAQTENQIQRRADLIPNLVNTTKGYAAHEKEVFTAVTEARAKVNSASTPAEKDAANTELSSALNRLMVVVENYPQLKADKHFSQLMDELAGTENRIAVARRDYVKAVNNYNSQIVTFPKNIFASMYGFEKMEQFAADEKAKEVPTVDFSK